MFRLRMGQCLDDEGELIVELRYLPQRGRVFGVLGHGEHFSLQGIFNCNADVVDGWRRGGLIGGIDANGIRQFDRAQRKEVGNQSLWDLRKKDGICAKYLTR